MSKFGKNHCKNLFKMCKIDTTGLFHTTKNYVFPNIGSEETCTPAYLQCLRPATMPISDAQTLAGDPRAPGRCENGIKPEIYERWNNTPKIIIQNDWSLNEWWDKKGLYY